MTTQANPTTDDRVQVMEAPLGSLGAIAETLATDGPEWLRELRSAALEKARELGFPARNDEAWRYTNPSPIVDQDYTLQSSTGEAEWPVLPMPDVDSAIHVVFLNGRLDARRSSIEAVKGLMIEPVAADSESLNNETQAVIREAVSTARDGFEALSAGLLTAGAVIRVDRNVVLDRPIRVTFVNSQQDECTVSALHVVVRAGSGAQVSVIEDHVGTGSNPGLTLGMTSLIADEGALIEHATLFRDGIEGNHVSTLRMHQARDSRITSHRMMLGGATVRNSIWARLEGENGDAVINGIYLPEHRQHHDTHVRVEHRAPHCTSRQYYRGVLGDHARGIFTGRIYVDAPAQKTDAIQNNANLLLSNDARVYSRPQLEIFADDVRCTHGATTGKVDDDALFYLRARGLPEELARLMLLHAFVGENIDRIGCEPLRQWVADAVESRLDAMVRRNLRPALAAAS